MSLNIDTFIISWTGQHLKASKIADALHGKANRITTVFSDKNDISILKDRWICVPNEHFSGKKFELCLAEFDGDIMLYIAADAQCHDWPSLLRSCERAFTRNSKIGVWSPDITYSPFSLAITSLSVVEGTSLHLVPQTDSIVWALSKDTIGRLRSLDYNVNNLGWGIDTFASVYCHSTSRLVLVDAETTVFHPLGTGYDELEARRQEGIFWTQMTSAEVYQCKIIRGCLKQQWDALASAGVDWRTPIRRNAPCPCGSGKHFGQCHGD